MFTGSTIESARKLNAKEDINSRTWVGWDTLFITCMEVGFITSDIGVSDLNSETHIEIKLVKN